VAGEKEWKGKREKEGREKGNRGVGKGKGREGKRGGRERGRRREREGRGSLRHWRWGDRLPYYRLKVRIALYGNPSQSYGASLAIWDHTDTCKQ